MHFKKFAKRALIFVKFQVHATFLIVDPKVQFVTNVLGNLKKCSCTIHVLENNITLVELLLQHKKKSKRYASQARLNFDDHIHQTMIHLQPYTDLIACVWCFPSTHRLIMEVFHKGVWHPTLLSWPLHPTMQHICWVSVHLLCLLYKARVSGESRPKMVSLVARWGHDWLHEVWYKQFQDLCCINHARGVKSWHG